MKKTVDTRDTWVCPLCKKNFGKVQGYEHGIMLDKTITHLFTACGKKEKP